MKIPNLIEAKKEVFGTYSAMALMNVQMVLDYIQQKAGIELDNSENENYWIHPVMKYLWDVKSNGDINPEKTQFVFEKLFECFPFVKIMSENQREFNNKKNGSQQKTATCNELRYVLDCVFKVLKAYRDTTTHYIINDNKWDDGSFFLTKNEQPLAGMINRYYTVALRNTSEKYGYDEKDLAFIQNNRMKKERSIGGGQPKMMVNTDFFLSMQSKNNDHTGKLHLSGVGVAQLICLFLEKKYINVFLSKLNIGGNQRPPLSEKDRKAIHRSMAINSIRLPRERIHSDKSIESVSMDILNELKRCPKDLFDTLDYAGQSRFRTVSSDFNEVTMLRSTDRFAQLMLEYIDYNKLFKDIRFHVNMGKLRYLLNAEKHCIDGCTRVRVIEHPLNGYGRLGDMEQERKKNDDGTFADTGIRIRSLDEVKRDDATAENYPYVVDTRTRYILENNKVELCFCDEECVMPVVEGTENGRWYVDKVVPSCRMSALELPAMMFHMYLLGAAETEKHIRCIYDTYTRLFTALADGTLTKDNMSSFGIDEADMPQKVLDAVNGVIGKQKDIRAYTKKVLNEMLEDTERKIDRLKEDKKAVGSRDNKMGKRGFRQIVSGRLADFLAKDIVYMQPSLLTGDDYGMDRMTGLNYRVMQASIATYNGDGDNEAFDRFKKMFVNAGLVDGDRRKNHPFLYYALKRRPTNTVEFYESYLYARRIYLERMIAEDKTNVPFVNHDKHKWCERNADFYKITGEIYLNDISIELPRQMFDEPIKNKLKTIPEMAGVDFDNANVTYLIGEYMKRVKGDGPQEFYSWKRHYRYIDMLTGKTDNKGSLCEQYTTVEEREKLWQERAERAEKYKDIKRRAKQSDRNKQRIPNKEFENGLTKILANNRNDYQKTEKVIRRYKVQDALLFLMAEHWLTLNIENFAGKQFKLKNIMPDSDNGILSEVMPIDFRFYMNNTWYTIHSDAMKIKNYGDFYTLIHDKRLSSLLELVGSATIEKESIETEFENYDDSRYEVVKLVFDLEKLVYEKYPDMKNYPVEKDKFNFGVLLNELVTRGEFTQNDTWVLSQIRNAFSHNSYPKTGVVKIKVLPEIARHLINVFESRAKIE